VYRRQVLEAFLKPYDLSILSLTNAIALGTPDHIYIDNDIVREYTKTNQEDLPSIN